MNSTPKNILSKNLRPSLRDGLLAVAEQETEVEEKIVITPEHERIFDRAKVQLLIQQPFYASLLLRFTLKFTDKVPIAAADGQGNIIINMQGLIRVASEKNADATTMSRRIVFILAHEIMHIAFAHVQFACHKRLDMKIYNYATDFVINQLLDDGKVGDRPEGLCFNPELVKKFNYDSFAIYNYLLKEMEEKGGICYFDGNGMKSLDELLDSGAISKEQYEKVDGEMRQMVASASVAARMQGKHPAFLDKVIDEFLESKVHWREALAKYVNQIIETTDRSYSRFSRKGQHMGLYLPATSQDMSLREIVIGMDTSGSCQGFLEEFAAEMNAIKQTYNLKARIIYCDYAIGNEEVFEQEDDLVLKTVGGGGTSFAPVTDRCNELLANNEIDENSILVFFTDLYGDFGNHCDIPVVWAVFGNPNPTPPPYGEIVIIDGKKD